MTAQLRFHARRHMVEADFTIDLSPGKVTALFGPSGSGKTTILRCLAGLDRVDAGSIICDEQVWDDGHRRFAAPGERHVGLVFQDHALFPHMSVSANIAYGLHRVPRRDRGHRVAAALAAVHAGHLAERRQVKDLSGGEAQRVALARALAPQPRLLLLDEPLSALDAPTRQRMRIDLRRILAAQGTPSILVTHDRTEALTLADDAIVIIDGAARQHGPVAQVFDRPIDKRVAEVVGVETALPARVVGLDSGIARVALGMHTVTALVDDSIRVGDEVYVCIRAEDVSLTAGPIAAGSSPRNHLAGIVISIVEEGALVKVELDVGVYLTSAITRPAAAELQIAPGMSITAVVKTTAVHLIRR